jgi:hypothetical protein
MKKRDKVAMTRLTFATWQSMLDRQLWLLELGRGAKSVKNQFVGHADPSLRN